MEYPINILPNTGWKVITLANGLVLGADTDAYVGCLEEFTAASAIVVGQEIRIKYTLASSVAQSVKIMELPKERLSNISRQTINIRSTVVSVDTGIKGQHINILFFGPSANGIQDNMAGMACICPAFSSTCGSEIMGTTQITYVPVTPV